MYGGCGGLRPRGSVLSGDSSIVTQSYMFVADATAFLSNRFLADLQKVSHRERISARLLGRKFCFTDLYETETSRATSSSANAR